MFGFAVAQRQRVCRNGDRDVRITKQLLRHMQAGRPLTALSARQTYGVDDLPREIYRIRARGYHVKQTEKTTLNKYTGIPQITTEYRMDAST